MKLRIRFLPRAGRELRQIRDWFEEIQFGLGSRFVKEVERALQIRSNYPGAGQRITTKVRRKVLRTFRYSVFYIIGDQTVDVLAIIHQADDPKSWPKRR